MLDLFAYKYAQHNSGSGYSTSGLLYSFAVFSDIHVNSIDTDWGNGISDFKNALKQSENLGCSLIAACGDLTYTNTTAELQTFKDALDSANLTIPFYTCKGNHDCMTTTCTDEMWNTYVGHNRNIVITKDNDAFIFVSQDYDSVTTGLTSTTISWLSTQLSTYANNRCFVFIHYPFANTCGNANGLYTSNLLDSTTGIGEQLWTLVTTYPNAIWFNGHTHLQLSCCNLDVNANLYWKPNQAKLVHVPSLATPRGDDDGDGVINAYNTNSEGYIVDVYSDHIILKGRDFLNGKYIENAQYYIDTTLKEIAEQTEDIVYSMNLSNATTYGTSTIVDSDNITINAGGDGTKEYATILIDDDKALYAKCDGITLSTGETDLSKLTFTMTFYTDSTKSTTLGMLTTYNCYLDETAIVCSNGYIPDETATYAQIVFKSSSSYAGTLPVTVTIDNFRLYQK